MIDVKACIRQRVKHMGWQNYITSSRTYRFLEILLGLWQPGRLSRHNKIALQFGVQLLRHAYSRSRPVIWTNTYTPPELILVLGGIPFMPEIAAATAASLGLSPYFLQAAEKAWFSTDLCSFHRCALGMAITRVAPRPDLIIATSHLCDGAVKFLEVASRLYNCPYYLLHIPYRSDQQLFLAEELRALHRELYPLLSVQTQDVGRIFHYSNIARENMLAVNELRKNIPAPWRGSEALTHAVMFLNALGTRQAAAFYRTLHQEMAFRVKKKRPVIPDQKYRLLWLHFKPYYSNSLMSLLESESGGVVIAFEEVSVVTWDRLDPDFCWESIAARILANPLWGEARNRVGLAVKLAREYAVQGVVHFSHWGCRQSTGMVNLLRNAFAEENIPFLELDGDCVDPRNFMEAQVTTRVQSFLEILQGY